MNPAPDRNSTIAAIFFQNTVSRVNHMKSHGGRFIYYTSAETAFQILTGKQLWMRHTMMMNDYMEVQHGVECLEAAIKSNDIAIRFDGMLNACHAGLAEEIRGSFSKWLPQIKNDSYITSLSEHPFTDGNNGRLSMWRAYGGNAGVGLVLNGHLMFNEIQNLGTFASPVNYFDTNGLVNHFERIISNMETNERFVREMSRQELLDNFFHLFRTTVLCTKHPGFHEENEWRVIASPSMFPSYTIKSTVEVVRGIPQIVLKIPLENNLPMGINNMDVSQLLTQIIIGPCAFPQVVANAFAKILSESGFINPMDRIHLSNTPLRQF